MSLTKRYLETQDLTLAQQLERAHHRVRFALRCAEDGSLDLDTMDSICRSLTLAMRNMEELKVQLLVAERGER